MDIEVTSHVGRDLLQSSRLFREDKDVVWEYVVNSLQYVERGVRPKVQVTIQPRKKVITIADNGRGMDQDGLRQFFQMHGVNQDRREGRGGRGKFGTGKSAAFGIARVLVIDTRRNGVRNAVRLSRDLIDSSDGENIPLEWTIQNEPTELSNGTEVRIEEISVPRIQTQRVVEYLERHLQSFRATEPEVAVNDHVCVFRTPEVEGEPRVFLPNADVAAAIGDVTLTVYVSRAPLTEVERGVLVTAGEGNTIAMETAGIERKEFGDYLFGMIDVPLLDQEVDGVEAFDSTRSLTLNLNHPVAARVAIFIGASVESVRKELVGRARDAARTEQARRLAQEANKIADVLNEDFEALRTRLEEIRAAAGTSGNLPSAFGATADGGDEEGAWIEGEAKLGDVPEPDNPAAEGDRKGRPAPRIARAGEPNPSGDSSVDPAAGKKKPKRPRGGFSVEYRPMGKEADRSQFNADALLILINLEHPVVAAALGDGAVEDPSFRRLSYEVAFAEYSMGIGYRMLLEDPDIPADDLLYEVRTTLNRVSRAAAGLYA